MKNNTNYSCLTIWKLLCVDAIFKMAAAVGLLLLQIGLFGQNKWCEKMHFTWFSRRDGFSPTLHQILPSPLRGSGQDTVSSWEKTPSLLENHVKCISSPIGSDSIFHCPSYDLFLNVCDENHTELKLVFWRIFTNSYIIYTYNADESTTTSQLVDNRWSVFSNIHVVFFFSMQF